MLVTALGVLWFFRRKGWLGPEKGIKMRKRRRADIVKAP
jgi:hypothetical protein